MISQCFVTYHWTCYFVPSLATLLNRFRVYLSLETAFKAFKNWYFDQNLGVGHEARFASFCFTLWWKIRILRILFHTMMKNGVCSMVSDTKLCNNVANYGTNSYIWNGPKKEKKSSLLKLFFILHFRLFHINFSNFWESTFQFPKKRMIQAFYNIWTF